MIHFPLLDASLDEFPGQADSLCLPGIAQLLVRQETDSFISLINRAVDLGVSVRKVEETILQCYLFDGYPTTIEGLQALRQHYPSTVNESNFVSGYAPSVLENWQARGESLCKTVYGQNYQRLISNVQSLSADLNAWFVVEGYGKVLSRTELDIRVRELVVIAILLWKRYPRQLHSHIHGAFNVDTSPPIIHRVIEVYARDKQLETDALKWWTKYNSHD